MDEAGPRERSPGIKLLFAALIGFALMIPLLLVYALLYVLLNLEAWSLLIGSVLLFVALAGVMYTTRNIDWSGVGRRPVTAG